MYQNLFHTSDVEMCSNVLYLCKKAAQMYQKCIRLMLFY